MWKAENASHIQTALDFDGCAVIVAVESLALMAAVTDEMPAAEHQMILRYVDLESLVRHDSQPVVNLPAERCGGSDFIFSQCDKQASCDQVSSGAGVELVGVAA